MVYGTNWHFIPSSIIPHNPPVFMKSEEEITHLVKSFFTKNPLSKESMAYELEQLKDTLITGTPDHVPLASVKVTYVLLTDLILLLRSLPEDVSLPEGD